MASVNLDDDELPGTSASTPASVNTTTSSGGGSNATDGTNTTGSTPASTGSTVGGTSQQDTQSPSNTASLNASADFSPLLNYVTGQGTAARNAINTENTNFNTGLGTGTGLFGTDQQNTLNSVLGGSQPLSTGQQLLNQSYTGPTGVTRSNYDPLVSTYNTDAQDTQNNAGIQTLMQQMTPGLSPGDRNFDATNFLANPAYMTQSQGLVNDANTVSGLGDSTATNAANAYTQRQSDVSAFNQAANNYVQSQADNINTALNNQITQAGTQDQSLQNEIPGLESGSIPWSSVPTNELGFNPASFSPTQLTSQYGQDVFNQSVNPLAYLNYQQGGLATRGNVATPDQITQYNNAQQLLNGYDQLSGSPRQGAMLNTNQQAFQQALAQAQAQMNAADAAYRAAHQPAPVAAPAAAAQPLPPVGYDVGHGSESSDSGQAETSDAQAGGVGMESQETADENAGNTSDTSQGADDDGEANSEGDEGGDEGGDDGGESGDGSGGFARGGLIGRPRKGADMQNTALPTNTSMPMRLQMGGNIPMNAGIPGVQDSVPARVNVGEFVTTQPSVSAIGRGNMAALNHINTLPPQQQQMVKNALHAALSKAALNRGRLH